MHSDSDTLSLIPVPLTDL